jgi:hypothetical protein
MARARSHRRRVSRAVERARGGPDAAHGLLLLLSFMLGAVLDWIRHQPFSLNWSWQTETFIILVAAWISVSLVGRWPQHEKGIARTAAVLLLVMFLGSVVLHVLLDHP